MKVKVSFIVEARCRETGELKREAEYTAAELVVWVIRATKRGYKPIRSAYDLVLADGKGTNDFRVRDLYTDNDDPLAEMF